MATNTPLPPETPTMRLSGKAGSTVVGDTLVVLSEMLGCPAVEDGCSKTVTPTPGEVGSRSTAVVVVLEVCPAVDGRSKTVNGLSTSVVPTEYESSQARLALVYRYH